MKSELDHFFQSMWADYLALNPDAEKIYHLFNQNQQVKNDHIALRTFGIDGVRVEDLAKPLVKLGYVEKQSYHFDKKHLRAKHYAHPTMPLIFISELIVESLSVATQNLIKQLVNQIDREKVSSMAFLYSGKHWKISTTAYNQLLRESEYAAWVAAFGYRPNHFTLNINELDHFKNIIEVNAHLKANGFVLNTSGGEIKGSKESFLEQSSTMANRISVEFTDGMLTIPSCFYEFAYRYPLANGQLFKGFVASSADKIFESTDNVHSNIPTKNNQSPKAA